MQYMVYLTQWWRHGQQEISLLCYLLIADNLIKLSESCILLARLSIEAIMKIEWCFLLSIIQGWHTPAMMHTFSALCWCIMMTNVAISQHAAFNGINTVRHKSEEKQCWSCPINIFKLTTFLYRQVFFPLSRVVQSRGLTFRRYRI